MSKKQTSNNLSASVENGSATSGKVGLLIVDMINDMKFDGAEDMASVTKEACAVISKLRKAARERGIPVIYVNDNFGLWTSDRAQLTDHVLKSGPLGSELANSLRPEEDDYFVIKPQFSGFYATTLPALLPRLGVQRLILTGISADICILFTAADAHMREYDLWIPADGIASASADRTRWSLEIMAKSMAANTAPTSKMPLEDWLS